MDNKKNNIIIFIISFSLLLLIRLTQLMGCKIEIISHQMLRWNYFINPLIIIMGVSLFNIFKNIRFENYIINKMMSVSLLIYIIHENLVLNDTLKPFIWQEIYERYGYKYIIFWVLALSVLCYFGSVVLGLIYKNMISSSLYRMMDKIYDNIQHKFENFENYLI